ncbi:MAG: hypothetical protein HYW07_22855 [Candidatus Latescibacteria bacterium]|nr:hypothetical protein [Candidatus Latescibacterota bacterium]
MKITAIQVCELVPPAPEQTGTPPRRPSWHQTFRQASPADRFDAPLHRREPGGLVWVKAVAEDGTWGLGNTDTGHVAAILIEECLAPMVVGQEVGALALCNDRMWRGTLSFGNEGLTARAVAGVDLALWDLWGKVLDQPVYRLAGGPCRQSMEVCLTGNDVDFTVQMCEALRPFRMRWMEEMLMPQDWAGLRSLRQRLPWQSLATGEHWSTRWPGARAIEERLVDLVQADLHWVGGFTEAMRLAQLADAAEIPMCLHTGANDLYGQHWTAAMPNTPLIEFIQFSAPGVPFEECHLAAGSAPGRRGCYRTPPGTPMPVKGKLGLPPGPGFGLEIPEAWLKPI